MRVEAALAWKTCTFGLTKKLPCLDSLIYKKLLNYTAIFGSFSIPNEQRGNSGNSIDLILVGKCHLSVIRLQKRKNNTVNEPY